LLTSALALFVAFHFLPMEAEFRIPGWRIWPDLVAILLHPNRAGNEPLVWIAIASFLNFSLLITASPFLGQVWRKSRIAWWLAVIFSGLSAIGIWAFYLTSPTNAPLLLGFGFILIAPILNFIGLLLARGGKPNISGPPPP
jgi:hypothetical protein